MSPQAIDIAREEVPTAKLHVAPLQALPFESDTFDLVTLNDVLQHVDDRELDGSLRETRRVLRVDGALLVRTQRRVACETRAIRLAPLRREDAPR